MKVGDLVIRKLCDAPEWKWVVAREQRQELGVGVVLSKQMGGKPEHSCLTVYYSKVGKSWDIAESLMEVVSESR